MTSYTQLTIGFSIMHICSDCGNYVASPFIHTRWHESQPPRAYNDEKNLQAHMDASRALRSMLPDELTVEDPILIPLPDRDAAVEELTRVYAVGSGFTYSGAKRLAGIEAIYDRVVAYLSDGK